MTERAPLRLHRRRFAAALLAGAAAPLATRASSRAYVYDAQGRWTGTSTSDTASTMVWYDTAGNRVAYRTGRYVGQRVDTGGVDPDFYTTTYDDIRANNIDPVSHYANNGWKEGRDPNGYFSTTGYLNAYPDVKSANINPLTHYYSNGWHENRDPSGLFKTSAYLQNYPDIAQAGINPLDHFLRNGIREGRQPFGDGKYTPR